METDITLEEIDKWKKDGQKKKTIYEKLKFDYLFDKEKKLY